MNEKLRNYIESIFEDAPQDKETVELKEEILQNTIDRYNDLRAEGKSEVAAFNIAVAGIGDVTELLASLHQGPQLYGGHTKEEIEASKQRTGIFTAVAVMLYILCVVPCILLGDSPLNDTLGPCLMFLMIAVATGLIIYSHKTALHYTKQEDTVVENFKEWNSEKSQKNALMKAVNSCIWAVGLVAYFVLSFTTGAWHITWVIFPLTGAVCGIVKACFDLTK